jgi:hypothetical protein
MKIFLPIILLLSTSTFGQKTIWKDSTNKLELSGYFDGYYNYLNQKSVGGIVPYFYSTNRVNELSVNLAYIKATFSNERFTLNIAPGFGTYMDASYGNEPFGLNNILEANISYKVFKKKNMLVDFGIFPSPYTNETAISKDHLAYTRSLSAENVPYFLSGLKTTHFLSKKLKFFFYIMNGWQEIHDPNDGKSIGTQLEYKRDSTITLNWNTYVGSEKSALSPNYRTRLFSDVFLLRNHKKWNFSSCFYAGAQEIRTAGIVKSKYLIWTQANAIAQYNITPKIGLVGRIEYFSDPDLAIAQAPYTGLSSFECGAASLGLNFKLDKQVLFRLESRTLYSDKKIYESTKSELRNNSTWFSANITAWF